MATRDSHQKVKEENKEHALGIEETQMPLGLWLFSLAV